MGKNPIIDCFWMVVCTGTYCIAFKPWEDWFAKEGRLCPRCSHEMHKVRGKDYWYCENANCNNVIRIDKSVKVGA